jgi:hypothetical protein
MAMKDRESSAPDSSDDLQLHTFGPLLREFRERYVERIGSNRPGMPRIKLTAQALIQCMEERGYKISSGSYSAVEAGTSFPRDIPAFVMAISKCLSLDDTELQQLIRRLTYDIVRSKLGDYADRAFD